MHATPRASHSRTFTTGAMPAKSSKPTAAVAVPSAEASGTDGVARGLGAGAAVVAVGGVGQSLRRKRSAAQ